jgi:hypothetical protein
MHAAHFVLNCHRAGSPCCPRTRAIQRKEFQILGKDLSVARDPELERLIPADDPRPITLLSAAVVIGAVGAVFAAVVVAYWLVG